MNEQLPTVCLSAGGHYVPEAVFAAASWRRFGHPVSVSILTEPDGPSALDCACVLALCGLGCGVDYSDAPHTMANAKMERYYAAEQAGRAAIISDADMIRLRPLPDLPRPRPGVGTLVSWGANLYDGTEWEPRYPGCYLAAMGLTWRALDMGRYLYAGPEPNGNWSDELVLKRALECNPAVRVHRIDRPRICPMAAADRLERNGWGAGLQTEAVTASDRWDDAHLPRPLTVAACNWLEDWFDLGVVVANGVAWKPVSQVHSDVIHAFIAYLTNTGVIE